jgi:hypothetical protein
MANRWLPGVQMLSLVLSCGVLRAQDAVGRPSIPKSGSRIEDFVPAGYRVCARAEADFNGDGLTDVVVVIESESEREREVRPLLVLFRGRDGGYTLSARADRAVPPPETGGTHGDGFNGLEVRRNTFGIVQGGGSSTAAEDRFQFRYQKGDWFLIGEKQEAVGNVEGECVGLTLKEPDVFSESTLDRNFLTGEEIRTCGTEKGEVRRRRRKVPRVPLIRLESFGY